VGEPSSELHLEPTSLRGRCSLGNDTVVGAHFGRAGRGPKMDLRRVSRLVERTAVGEGERDGVSKG
jgi:hypothetical protein